MKKILILFASLTLTGAAVAAADECAPSKVNITVESGKTTAVVSWNATGDDCTTGNATRFEIRRSTSTITDTNWQSASIVAADASEANGNPQCIPFTVSCNTSYYWCLFLFDEADNRSPISNVVQQNTLSCGSSQQVICD